MRIFSWIWPVPRGSPAAAPGPILTSGLGFSAACTNMGQFVARHIERADVKRQSLHGRLRCTGGGRSVLRRNRSRPLVAQRARGSRTRDRRADTRGRRRLRGPPRPTTVWCCELFLVGAIHAAHRGLSVSALYRERLAAAPASAPRTRAQTQRPPCGATRTMRAPCRWVLDRYVSQLAICLYGKFIVCGIQFF